MPTADQNTAWQYRVRVLLKDGFGVEDIAVQLGVDVEHVRAEVSILRASGEIKAMFDHRARGGFTGGV